MPMERSIVGRAANLINGEPGAKCIKIHGSPLMERGTPDLIGSYQGRTFAIETKQPGEKPDPIQVFRLREWKRAGARTGVAQTPEEALILARGDYDL